MTIQSRVEKLHSLENMRFSIPRKKKRREETDQTD